MNPSDFYVDPLYSALFCVQPENKNSRFRLEIRRLLLLLFFKVVSPGIEPFALVYSNSLSDCTFLLYLL